MRSAAALTAAAALAAACSMATENIPRVDGLTVTEANAMSCAELNAELARVEALRIEIRGTEEIDWSNLLGIVGNYAPGNERARERAEEAVDARIADIQAARAQNGCVPALLGDEIEGGPTVITIERGAQADADAATTNGED